MVYLLPNGRFHKFLTFQVGDKGGGGSLGNVIEMQAFNMVSLQKAFKMIPKGAPCRNRRIRVTLIISMSDAAVLDSLKEGFIIAKNFPKAVEFLFCLNLAFVYSQFFKCFSFLVYVSINDVIDLTLQFGFVGFCCALDIVEIGFYYLLA